jgi:dethiobiotin synthetase
MTPKQPIAICGIDTGVGKSIVTGLLARHLLDRGQVVITQKPVQTGCKGRSEDILLHRRLMGADWHRLDEEKLTCSYTFPFPASPHLAARLAGREIDPAVIDQATATLTGQVDQLIIEGAGGLLVPLTPNLLQLDYFAGHDYPVILVSSPRLGSINHTLLCLEAIRQRNMQLLGIVYNLYGDHPREIVTDSLKIFRQHLGQHGFPEKVIILPDTDESRSTNWDVLLG